MLSSADDGRPPRTRPFGVDDDHVACLRQRIQRRVNHVLEFADLLASDVLDLVQNFWRLARL
jgi:hypothetical protein